MHQVQLADRLYAQAQRRATAAGYTTVDEYVADVVGQDLAGEGEGGATPDLDILFTPERLVHIEAADAAIQAGHFYKTEQADAELAKRRAEWLRKNPS